MEDNTITLYKEQLSKKKEKTLSKYVNRNYDNKIFSILYNDAVKDSQDVTMERIRNIIMPFYNTLSILEKKNYNDSEIIHFLTSDYNIKALEKSINSILNIYE